MPTRSDLTNAITDAARRAFSSLFENHPGCYYYCSLITTGEAHPPVIAAWSHEALAATTANAESAESAQMARRAMKWSYADSPFYCYGEELFESVNRLFAERPKMNHEMTKENWDSEYQLRIDTMESAMARLDSEGVFGSGDARLGTVVLVEVMPPDHSNTDRALRLNPMAALGEWLAEAAELEE